MTIVLSILLYCCIYHFGYSLKDVEPLILTPYIDAGKIKEGQKAAEVRLPGTNVVSYAGFFNVNKTYNSNLFFWFFQAEQNPKDAPVVVWLQGGPGVSSLYGLFNENGPFYLDEDENLKPRQYSWSKVFNLLYIDNPVGTGFSFTDDERGYVKDEVGVGRDLFSALSQFFQLFPTLIKNDFYVTGESYAGKYVPAIAYAIHTNKQLKLTEINLKGIAIGNGLTDPENMMLYDEYLFQIGLIDLKTKAMFRKKQDEILENIRNKNYSIAYEQFHNMIAGDLDSFFHFQTGFSSHYNYLHDEDYSSYGDYSDFVQETSIRTGIHVGNRTFQDGHLVLKNLKSDFMQSVRPWIEELLEHYRVLFYNGQLDIICAYPLTINALEKLEWSGTGSYKNAQREKWIVDNELAGYSKSAKGLTEVMVRNAGHMAPNDQPKWLLDLVTSFVFNKKLN